MVCRLSPSMPPPRLFTANFTRWCGVAVNAAAPRGVRGDFHGKPRKSVGARRNFSGIPWESQIVRLDSCGLPLFPVTAGSYTYVFFVSCFQSRLLSSPFLLLIPPNSRNSNPGSPSSLFFLLPTAARALPFYRENTFARIQSLVGSRRIVPTHATINRRSRQLVSLYVQ